MIDFRYHVVSIIAVFLALTVGLVIGASVINQETVALLNRQLNDANNTKLAAQEHVRTLQDSTALYQQYIDGTAATLVNAQLANVAVAVIQVAGEDAAAAAGTEALIQKASALISVDLTINPSFTDPNNAQALTAMVQQCTPTRLVVDGTGATAAMQLLAAAVTAVSQPAAQPTATPSVTPSPSSAGCAVRPATMTPSWAQITLSAFASQDVITVDTNPAAVGKPAAAFIAAPASADTAPQNAAYLTLAESLHADGVGALVGGVAAAAGPGGLISAVRADPTGSKTVSTVDDTDQTMGQVAVVFVVYQMVQSPEASAGHYGQVGSNDGLLPAMPAAGTSG